MEAVPRMPMLCFELKHSPEYVEFGPALKKYIRDNYGEDPAHYNKACTDLEQLRQTAVQVSQDFMGCSTLKKYFAQLQFLASRFPMEDGGEAAIAFTWEDVYSGRDYVHNDIKFEQVCILYNIGALHSILGAMDTRQTAEGMKVSCTHFQCAAWAYEHLRDHFGCSSMSTDLSYEVMTFYISLMLAQAQECILEKSMTDSRKSSITAKVSAQIVEFYNNAIKHLDTCNSERIISSSRYKEWKKRLQLKAEYYMCITYYFMGRQAEDQQKFGERLTYFQASNDKLQLCSKLSKGDIEDIQETLKFTNDVVMGKFQAAKKDNDFIYHEKLPPIDSLPEVKGASLVKGIPFNPSDLEVSGPDIFQKLVPMEAHEASSVYSEEKAKLLRKIDCEIAEKKQELSHFMSMLQLDPSKLNPEPERLPQPLLEKCAAMSVRSDAIKELIDSMSGVSGVATEVDIAIRDIYKLLNEDAEREAEHQKIFGKQSPLIILSEIKKECEMYDDAHKKGNELNAELHKAMSTHIANLKLLIKPPDEIQKSLPSLESVKDPENEAVRQELLKLLSKVDEMKNQRASLEEQLRKQIHEDDITNVIVTAQDNKNKDAIYHDQLKKHDTIIGYLHQNLSAQDNILRAITDANARFAGARKTHSEHSAKRDAMIQSLINSYNVYEDLLTKSQRGLEYYQKLEANISRLLQRCSSVCKVQQEERDQIMKRHMAKQQPPPPRPVPGVPANTASLPSSSQVPSAAPSGIPGFEGPKLKDYLPFMKPKTFGKDRGSPPQSMTPPGHFSSTEIGGSSPGSLSGSPVHVVNPSGCLPQSPMAHQRFGSPSQGSPSHHQQSNNQSLPSQSSYEQPGHQINKTHIAQRDQVDSRMNVVPSTVPPSGYNLPHSQYSTSLPGVPPVQNIPSSQMQNASSLPGVPPVQSVPSSQMQYASSLPGVSSVQNLPSSQTQYPTSLPVFPTVQNVPSSQTQFIQGQQHPQLYVQQNTNTVSAVDTPVVTPSKTTDGEEYGQHSHMTAGYSVHQYSHQQQDIPVQYPHMMNTQSNQPVNPSLSHMPKQNINEAPKSELRHSQPMPLPGSPRPPFVESSHNVPNQQANVPINQQYPPVVSTPQPVSYGQTINTQYNVNPQHLNSGNIHQQQLNPTNMQAGMSELSSQVVPPAGLQHVPNVSQQLPVHQTSQSYPTTQVHALTQHTSQQIPPTVGQAPHQVHPSQVMQHPHGMQNVSPHPQQIGQMPPSGQPTAGTQGQVIHSGSQPITGVQKPISQDGSNYYQQPNIQQGKQVYPASSQPVTHISGVVQQMPHNVSQQASSQQVPVSQQHPTVSASGPHQLAYSSIHQPVNQGLVSQQQSYQGGVNTGYNTYTTATSSMAPISSGQYVAGGQFSNNLTQQPYTSTTQPQVQQGVPHSLQQTQTGHGNFNNVQAPQAQQYGTKYAPPQQQTHGQVVGNTQNTPKPPDVTLRTPSVAPTNVPYNMADQSQTHLGYRQQPVSQTAPQTGYQSSNTHQQSQQLPGPVSQPSQNSVMSQQMHYSSVIQAHPPRQPQPGYQQYSQREASISSQSSVAQPIPNAQVPQVHGQNMYQQIQGQQPRAHTPQVQVISSQPEYSLGNYQPGYQQPTQPVPQQVGASIPPVYQNQPASQQSQSSQQSSAFYQQHPRLPNIPQSGTILQPQKEVRSHPPDLTQQFSNSSLDEILSSSPSSKEKIIEHDNVLTPKVLTAQEIQQQKEEALQKGTLKTSLKDPFSDPRAINKLKNEAEEFAKNVADLTEVEVGTHHSKMDVIWKGLMDEQDKEGKKRSMAIARCYPMKNREPDIMPYDDTRVLLTGNKDDYINANWIIDLCASCPKFIATQSPLPVTLIDFWSMVYEQGSEVIVHLTSDIDSGKKFPVYWPTEKGQTVHHGHLSLTLQSFKDKNVWIERIIYVTNNETKQGRTIVHLQFLNWPISGFPEKVEHILDFITEVHNFYKQQRSLLKPVIVHCSNGIGRTGTFLLSYIGIQELEHGNGLIDIPRMTKHMLERRKQIIRDSDQLKYCYEVLLCYAESILLRKGIVIQNPWRRKQNQAQEKQKLMHKQQSGDILFGSSKIDNLQSTISKLGLKEHSPQMDSKISSTEQDMQLATLPDVVQQPNKSRTSLPSSLIGSPQVRSRSGSTSSQKSTSSLSDTNQVKNVPSSLAVLQDPQTFSLGTAETKKKKISKTDFGSKTNVSEQSDPNDPLNSLDPMWNIKK